MRIFEIKVSGSAKVSHSFMRDNEFKVSGTDVKLGVYSIVDENEEMEAVKTHFVFDYDQAMLLDLDAVYNPTTKAYEYTLDISSDQWPLGAYLLEWTGTIEGSEISEFDKLYVVTATRDEIAKVLEMPSSISAGGITIDYSSRLVDLTRQRGIRVGRITNSRGAGRSNTAERDYDRTGRKYNE